MPNAPPIAVTFDFGQTLAELDTTFLSKRLSEKGISLPEATLEVCVGDAWHAYDTAVRQGVSGHPWRLLMTTLLERAGAPADRIAGVVEWLWDEQPKTNLWRRLLPDMVQLARDVRAASVPIGVISNSEGGRAQLVGEVGLGDLFAVVLDSGQLGIEKPDRRIFQIAADRLEVDLPALVHVGDSFGADVRGAHDAGARAIYFPRTELLEPLPRARAAPDAAAVRRILSEWGAPVSPAS
jgi:HAD superfamily hydrolase (TIGR01549 family)